MDIMKAFLTKVWEILEEMGKARAKNHTRYGWY